MRWAFVTLALLALTGGCALAEHATTTTVETNQLQPQQNSAYDPEKYPETKQLRDTAYLNHLLSEEYSKRASMRGFQGMRGKKSNDLFDEDYYYDKRAPMGFQGTRGKKAEFNDLDDDEEFDKRAPMGFQGTRGKKTVDELLDELEKRQMLGFQGMRGKKAEEYEEDIPELSPYYEELDDWHKRAPMGFQGSRGRKSFADDMEKRALLGFHGMRGKKNFYEQEDMLDNYLAKRPLYMGFKGSRGKRGVADYYGPADYGRYYRMPYVYFGNRGKKNPRLAGKFIGTRGKKWSPNPPRLNFIERLMAEYPPVDTDLQ